MGTNTTVVVMNDSLLAIEKDPTFGYKLARAIATGIPQDVSAMGHANAATIIEQHPADFYTLIRVGKNFGVEVGKNPKNTEKDLEILKEYAQKLGYKLIKQGKRR